ncbi:MAG: hypothetical protein FD174_2221 [Geobacteraceae bacterium]|nr:MAG: hypothetical protein FD174_2221 [Geobacteraceae bacterium]
MVNKVATIWASFIPIAIANGLLREKCLVPLLGQRLALPLSGIFGSILFFLLTYLTLPWLGPLKPRHYQLIGLAWLAMTVLFEFLFGRLVAHKSWGELLQAYDLTTGNLWLLVLVVIAVSPHLAAKVRGLV